MERTKRHLLFVSRTEKGWMIFVDGQLVETFRVRERALSWADLWKQTAAQKGANVEVVVRESVRV